MTTAIHSHLRVPRFSWSLRATKDLLSQTFNEWTNAEAARMGAALAYYAMLSIAPLLILIIGIASLVWDAEAVQGELAYRLEGVVGSQAAETIQALIKNTGGKGGGIIASVIGFLTLVVGATSIVAELRSSMNKLWKVKERSGLVALLRQRSYAFFVIAIAGFLLLASMLVSAALATMGAFFSNVLPTPEWILQTINFVVSLVFLTAVFASLFKTLPKVSLEWHDVLLGAAFTALLFTVGKTAIGLYLGKSSFASTFGAAGSLVIVLVWIYYSAQLFFFGAEFTRVYAKEYGSRHKSRRTQKPVEHGGDESGFAGGEPVRSA
jgi:membrane protein